MGKEQIKQRVRTAVRTMPVKEHVKTMYLFGSQLRGDAQDSSDIDLLIDLAGAVGYFELVRMEKHLEQALGLHVDLVTEGGLSKYIRPHVFRERELIYEA